jgi:outer membrane protein OmpA-like peptidoglycan-associated protein
MKNIFRTHRRNPPQHNEEQQTATPFFNKTNDSSNGPFFSKSNSVVQTKLSVGQPGDVYEQEADAVADAVVQNQQKGTAPAIQQKGISSIQRTLTSAGTGAGTAEERMKEDQLVQEKREPSIQKMDKPLEEDEAVKPPALQKMNMPKEEEDPLAKGAVQKKDMPKEEEEKPGAAPAVMTKPDGTQTASPQLSQGIESSKGSGSALPDTTRAEMEASFGHDFSGVNVHTGQEATNLNKGLHAQAFTQGQDVYFNAGKYSPETTEGKRLLAHELTHVVQQNSDINRKVIQCDLIEPNLPTSNGIFEMNMIAIEGADETPPTTQASLDGSIKFTPDVDAPYSNEIKLIQIIKVQDTSGTDVDIASMPPGRGSSLRTTANPDTGVEGGFHTDVLHQNFDSALAPTSVAAPDSQKRLNYEGGAPVFGFKRSNDPQDIKSAEITDTPGSNGDIDFAFETVAKGEDTNTIYGSLNWSFETRSGRVENETASVTDGQSATFDEAVELHRNFYVHEPVTFYFGFDNDTLSATETGKIDAFLDYMTRFPDVELSIEGFADRRGDPDYNMDLSLRRAQAVEEALIAKGIDEARINDIVLGSGATEEFTSGDLAPNPGRDQDLEANRRGNRRVVVTFEHTTS